MLERLRRQLGLRKEIGWSGRVLDIGAGDNRRGTVGVDITPADAVDVRADGRWLPFDDDSFDHVLAYHLIEHLTPEATEQLLIEATRVCRPDGVVHLLVDRDRTSADLFEKDETHVWRYDPWWFRTFVDDHLDVQIYQTHNLLGNLHQYPLTWWRHLTAATKIYVEGSPA